MVFRRFIDIRTTPLILGYLQFTWATIPVFDDKDLSLFARVLGQTEFETLWIAVGLTLGLLMMISAVVKWRAMLLWSEALSCFAWAATFAPFIEHRIYTPVTLAMPAFSVVCLMLTVREVMAGIQLKSGTCQAEGFRDLQRSA